MTSSAIAAISEAYGTIDPVFLNTPQFESEALNQVLDLSLVLKVETLNPIRSFKGRGTDFFVARHAQAASFVCASAGNFGQGMAYACRKHGIPLTLFAAETANPLKLERMGQLGAQIRLAARDFDGAKAVARAYAETTQQTFVEDGREPDIALGAGTIGLELSRYGLPIDTLLVPVGNGALITGIALWAKAQDPAPEVIGVVAAGAPAMALSWRQGAVVTTPQAETIADGIAVRQPVPEVLPPLAAIVDDMVSVTDGEILKAMRLAHRVLGLVLEPAGAVGLAAAMVYRQRFRGRRLGTPLCGSNLTPTQMAQWL